MSSSSPTSHSAPTLVLDPNIVYPESIFDVSTCLKKGFCLVARSKDRAAVPHKLYYEVHGDPSPKARKLLFIMGLNNSSFAWSNQVSHFARQRGYQILVHDNRGVGHSDTPKGLYKTSEMASDVVELIESEEIGWGGEGRDGRDLNVVGVSMGGMIALELATLIPTRIASLLLTSTKAGNLPLPLDLPSSKATWMFLRLLTGTVRTPEQGIALIVDSLFPAEWLDVTDPKDAKGRTRRETCMEGFMYRYNIGRKQTAAGRLGQMGAVLKHCVKSDRLRTIAESIPRVAIITGDQDQLINPQRSHELHENMPGSTLKIVEGAGHALPSQINEEYNAWIEEVVNREV